MDVLIDALEENWEHLTLDDLKEFRDKLNEDYIKDKEAEYNKAVAKVKYLLEEASNLVNEFGIYVKYYNDNGEELFFFNNLGIE